MRLFMSPGFVADVGRRAMESIASERPKIKSARLSIRGRGRLSLPPGRSRLSPPAKGGIDKVTFENRLAYFIFIQRRAGRPKRPEALSCRFQFSTRARQDVERGEFEGPRGGPGTSYSKGRHWGQGSAKPARSLAGPDREVRVYRL